MEEIHAVPPQTNAQKIKEIATVVRTAEATCNVVKTIVHWTTNILEMMIAVLTQIGVQEVSNKSSILIFSWQVTQGLIEPLDSMVIFDENHIVFGLSKYELSYSICQNHQVPSNLTSF